MTKLYAIVAALFVLAAAPEVAAETLEGTIVAIDASKSKLTIGGADVIWKEAKGPDFNLADFKVGDVVRVEYTQDDVHEPYMLKTIRKK